MNTITNDEADNILYGLIAILSVITIIVYLIYERKDK